MQCNQVKYHMRIRRGTHRDAAMRIPTSRYCLVALVVATLFACANSQNDHEELQTDQELADEEDSHWGVALALLALQTSLQREPDALRTLNSLAAKVDLALATVETRGKDSLAEQPINDFISTDKSLADDLTQNGTTSATQLLDGLITITDPQLFSDGSAKIRNTAVGAALTATGLSYSPCMVVSAPAGAVLSAQGVVISPTGVRVGAAGAVLGSVGLDINPTLITVGAVDQSKVAVGFSIAPSIIKVTPTVSLRQHIQKDLSGTALVNVKVSPPRKPGASGAGTKSDGP